MDLNEHTSDTTQKSKPPESDYSERTKLSESAHSEKTKAPENDHSERTKLPESDHSERTKLPENAHSEKTKAPENDHSERTKPPESKHSERTVYPDYADTEPCRLQEAAVAYGRGKKQGEYTLEDYYALPDDVRTELIDGSLYLMAAPSVKHQWILAQLTMVFGQYIKRKKGKCMVFPAPLDVQLDCDIWTMLQPDLTILCDRSIARENKIYGAPDFVVEILSPSTRRKDTTIKLRKYREAGVRECWLIDPKKEVTETYLFRNPNADVLPCVYTFDDVVPVGIYDGDCEVDFPDMFQNSMWPRGEGE